MKFIDLFAGIGGFRIALTNAGLDCCFSSEIDKFSRKIYNDNYGEFPSGDIRQIKESEIPSHDIICAGFPCQPFSISGTKKGLADERGQLINNVVRIAKYHNPKVILLENVKNLVKHNGGDTFNVIKHEFENIGYNLYYKVLNSNDYGVAQSRERVYIVCFRKDLNVKDFKFPDKHSEKVMLRDIIEKDIDNTNYLLSRNDITYCDRSQEFTGRTIQIGKIGKGRQGERVYSINGSSITLSANGGGVAGKTGAYLIDGVVRKLTAKECLRLQGFPEDFIMDVKIGQAHRQLGNSVTIPVIQAIIKQILKKI